MAARRPIFGKPPFRFLAEYLAHDADFLNDAREILKLDQDSYLRLANRLAKSDAFLSRSDLAGIVGDVLGRGDDSDRIASIVDRLGGIVHDADMDVADAMDALETVIVEKAAGLEPSDRKILADRIRKLAAEPMGIAKQCKARQMVDAIGAGLADVQIICDIRPIFDPKREQIDGAIPLAILRLDYHRPDGESAVEEIRVTEKQIAELEGKILVAKRKLSMIKGLLASQNLTVPRTKSTISEDE